MKSAEINWFHQFFPLFRSTTHCLRRVASRRLPSVVGSTKPASGSERLSPRAVRAGKPKKKRERSIRAQQGIIVDAVVVLE